MIPKVSFIIPTINQNLLVKHCIDSLINHHPDLSEYEVILIDDGSRQEIISYLTHLVDSYLKTGLNINFIRNTQNSGFPVSVNKGITASKSSIPILTNNDILFTQNVINPILSSFSRYERIGIVGGLLLYPDNSIQHGGVGVSQHNTFYHVGHHQKLSHCREATDPQYRIAVTGALYAIRKEMSHEIGLLREDFFLSGEDVEYCLRTWLHGYRVYYNPEITAIHYEGYTRGNTEASKKTKDPKWLEKEAQAQRKLRFIYDSLDRQSLFKTIAALNNKPITTPNSRVLGIHRSGALGDVLFTTGIIRKIKELCPDLPLFVSTKYPEIFENSPYIEKCFTDPTELHSMCTEVLSLDLQYEKNPNMHIIDAYKLPFPDMLSCTKEDLYPEIFQPEVQEEVPLKITNPYIVFQFPRSWVSRTLSNDFLDKLFFLFKGKFSQTPVLLHKGNDYNPPSFDGIKLGPNLSIHQIHNIISGAEAFVGVDSGILHIANLTHTPTVSVFTCANPVNRIVRPPKHAFVPTFTIVPDVECTFCLHKQTPPVTHIDCPNNQNYACIKDITPEDILDALSMIKNGIRT